VLPNIYGYDQLVEFAGAVDTPAVGREELDRIAALYANNFGLQEPPMSFKGTMEPSEPTATPAR
jgi:hypothetical protein